MVLSILLTCSCSSDNNNDAVEVTQSRRNNVCNIKDKVKELPMGDIIIGRFSSIYGFEDNLMIADSKADELYVNVFDPTNFTLKGRFGRLGPGPDEITNPGEVVMNEDTRTVYIFDFGKWKVLGYDLDSALVYSNYKPWTKIHITSSSFPSRLKYVNDSTGFGREISHMERGNRFSQHLCTFKLATGEQHPFAEQERREGNRSLCSVSPRDSIVVEACLNNDLMLIYDFDGNVIRKVKGPAYSPDPDGNTSHFKQLAITPGHIFISYSGGSYNTDYYGSKVVVFNHRGDYIKTLEIGRDVTDLCFNRKSNRLFFIFDDEEMQFGYLDLDSIDLD